MNYCHSCGHYKELVVHPYCAECHQSLTEQYARAHRAKLDLGFDAAGHARDYGRHGSRDLDDSDYADNYDSDGRYFGKEAPWH